MTSFLLALCAVLAAGNWYLQPEHAGSWAAALLFLAGATLVLWFASRGSSSEGPRRQAAHSIRQGVFFGALIMAVSLGAKLAHTLGVLEAAGLSQRLAMVVMGGFFVFTGNALPKMLTPLAVESCDPARAQTLRRFAGWTQVLTGLAFALAWLVLPAAIARPVSVAFILGGGVAVITKALSARRNSRREA
jgi:hypothetical protein